jgi:Lar family restriction alleviation protein
MTTISPCPFCGGEASVAEGQKVGTRDSGWRWVRCRECGAQSGGHCHHSDPKRSERDAVKVWNKRAPTAPVSHSQAFMPAGDADSQQRGDERGTSGGVTHG